MEVMIIKIHKQSKWGKIIEYPDRPTSSRYQVFAKSDYAQSGWITVTGYTTLEKALNYHEMSKPMKRK